MHDPNESNESDGLVASARFVEAMRNERVKKGWSQRKLAEELEAASGLKLDPSAMTRMENGQREMKLNEAVAIARVLGIPMATVLTGKQEQLVRECMLWLGEWDAHVKAGQKLAERVRAALESGAVQPSILERREEAKGMVAGQSLDPGESERLMSFLARVADSDGVSGFVEFVESISSPESWRFMFAGPFHDLWVSPVGRKANP